jgi:PKD repeat protein
MAFKSMINGYVDRQGRPPEPYRTTWNVSGFVCNPAADPTSLDGMPWNWIMDPATQGAATTAIGAELDWAETNGLYVKIRIFNPPPATVLAAVPVRHLGGTLPTGPCLTGQEFTPAGYTLPLIAQWWSAAYIDAYFALHEHLASNFDSHNALRDVAFGGGCLDFAEPMIRRNYAGPATGPSPLKADYRKANYESWVASGSPGGAFSDRDKAALKELMEAHLAYLETRQSLASNPWQTITRSTCLSSGTNWPKLVPGNDIDGTFEMIDHWLEIMGDQGIAGNNSLRPNGPGPANLYNAMYDFQKSSGANVYYQTANNSQLDKQINQTHLGEVMSTRQLVLDHTVAKADDLGAGYVELPGFYKTPEYGLVPPPFSGPTHPVAAGKAVPNLGKKPLKVHFTGTATNPDGRGFHLHWDTDDGGVFDGPAFDHTYAVEGDYDAVLTATTVGGLTDSVTVPVKVNPLSVFPPIAVAAGTPATGPAPLTVNFTSAGSNDPDGGPLTYSWNFGDGSPLSSMAHPSHVYATPGSYTATLTVTDEGSQTASASVPVITISLPVPTAVIVVSPPPYVTPATITFNSGTSTAPGQTIISRAWDFGDGATSTAVSPTHAYGTVGDYTVKLTVVATDGQTDTEQVIIRVKAPDPTGATPTTPGVGGMIDVVRIVVPATETLIWDGGTGLGEGATTYVVSENSRTFHFTIRNAGAGAIFIGPKGKTGSATGFQIPASQQVILEAGFGDKIYGAAASGTAAVEVLVGGT